MKFCKKQIRRSQLGRWLMFAGLIAVLAGSGFVIAETLPRARPGDKRSVMFPADLRNQYAAVVHNVRLFEDEQSRAGQQIVPDRQLQDMISGLQLDAASGDFDGARADIRGLQESLDTWNARLVAKTSRPVESAVPGVGATGTRYLPILIYHYTPANFDEQLSHLEQYGYTVIDLDEALAGLHGGPLPAKPVVITFDDGFENQMQAFALLERHHMKATFYIINAGERSRWCIGAGRRYNDPLQPPNGCGDAYLTWDQVRQLDRSGLITIAGHTLDHENLASLPPDLQRMEIFDSKAGIETEIGHPIRHFAYPYGGYTATTIELAREAGYQTAVTTLPGSYQSPGQEFTLRRVRDTLSLP